MKEELETKALGEGAGSAGSLVKPEYGAEVPLRTCEGCGTKTKAAKCPECGKTMKKAVSAEDMHRAIDELFGKGLEELEIAPPVEPIVEDIEQLVIDQGKSVTGFHVDWNLDSKATVKGDGTLIIKGHGNTWQEDRDGETTAKKAFDASLTEYMGNPVLLLQHDPDKPIGFVTKAVPDDVGLYVEAEIPKPDPGSEPWHVKAYHDIKKGTLKAFSMGGVFIRSKDVSGLIEQVKLYEISVVTIPANPTSLFRVAGEKGYTQWSTKSGAISPMVAAALRGNNPIGTRPSASKEIHMKPDVDAGEQPTEDVTPEGGLDAKSANEVLERLSALEAEKKALDMERAAEAEAQKRLEAEAQADAEQKAAEQAEAKRISELVEQKMTALRGTKKFQFSGTAPESEVAPEGEKNLGDWLRLLVRKKNGDYGAFQKLEDLHQKAADAYGIKALTGTTSGAGGFLVPPQYWQQGIAEYRIAAAKVRGLCTVITTNSNLVYIPRETGISTVGWTAENTAKPSTDQTFGQIAINLYTLAGISKVSNQLLEDSSPAVDQIVRKDLGRGLGQQEDLAFINGDGNGKPTGILNTSGVLTGAIGAGKILDAIATAITSIQSNYFGDASAILVHPREVNVLRTAKDTTGRYLLEPNYFQGGGPQAGGANQLLVSQPLGGGYSNYPGISTGMVGTVWGLPVIADANMPTNLGAGTNESPIIVGNFEEAYVIDRMGVTLDVSNEAGTSFETNQTWFRGEERVGFTAARQPLAFYVISGLTPTAG